MTTAIALDLGTQAPHGDSVHPHSAPRSSPVRDELAIRLAGEMGEPGPLGEALRHHHATGGSRARAQLALETGHALGLSAEASLRIAVACELLHNASLVHDDLQDRDPERRGEAAVWARFGDEMAVNVGDYLLARAFDNAGRVEVSPRAALAVLQEFTRATATAVRGQVRDNAYTPEDRPDLEAYDALARAKTGGLMALPVLACLAAAGASERTRRAAARAFEDLGLAFQVQDDLADLLGRKGRTPASDLRAGRPNVVALLHRLTLDDRIEQLFERARGVSGNDSVAIDSLVAHVRLSASVDHAVSYADRALAAAKERARELPAELHPIFARAAESIARPIDEIRILRLAERAASEVPVEYREREIAIPVDGVDVDAALKVSA